MLYGRFPTYQHTLHPHAHTEFLVGISASSPPQQLACTNELPHFRSGSVWEARQKATFLHSPLRTESRVYFILNLRTVVVVVAAVELENLKFYRLSGFIPQTWHGMVCLDFFCSYGSILFTGPPRTTHRSRVVVVYLRNPAWAFKSGASVRFTPMPNVTQSYHSVLFSFPTSENYPTLTSLPS
jgi:hypothetical protein